MAYQQIILVQQLTQTVLKTRDSPNEKVGRIAPAETANPYNRSSTHQPLSIRDIDSDQNELRILIVTITIGNLMNIANKNPLSSTMGKANLRTVNYEYNHNRTEGQ